MFQDEAKSAAGGMIPGTVAFKFYDTYGLALDEQDEMAKERGMYIDHEGFAAEMERQRTRARASWKGADKTQSNPIYQTFARTEFIGRETLEAPATVIEVVGDEIILDRTPFYAEAGGQVGDRGVLVSKDTGASVIVDAAVSPAPGIIAHRIPSPTALTKAHIVIAHIQTSTHTTTIRNL